MTTLPETIDELDADDLIAVASNIAALETLEAEMRKHPDAETEIIHRFAPGVYAREMRVPAGTFLTGKIHRYAHLNIMSAGDVTIVNETGRERIKAPYAFISAPGTKRAFYMHEFTVWTTIHATDETDVEKLERDLVVDNFGDLIKCPS